MDQRYHYWGDTYIHTDISTGRGCTKHEDHRQINKAPPCLSQSTGRLILYIEISMGKIHQCASHIKKVITEDQPSPCLNKRIIIIQSPYIYGLPRIVVKQRRYVFTTQISPCTCTGINRGHSYRQAEYIYYHGFMTGHDSGMLCSS